MSETKSKEQEIKEKLVKIKFVLLKCSLVYVNGISRHDIIEGISFVQESEYEELISFVNELESLALSILSPSSAGDFHQSILDGIYMEALLSTASKIYVEQALATRNENLSECADNAIKSANAFAERYANFVTSKAKKKEKSENGDLKTQ